MAVLRAAVAAAFMSTLMSFAVADTFYSTLTSFTGISDPLAFDGQVISSGNSSQSITLTAQTDVVKNFEATVTSGELGLSLKPGFTYVSTEPSNYTVRTPNGTLQSVATAGAGTLLIDGAVVSNTTLDISVTGASYTAISNCPSQSISASNTGAGTLVVSADSTVASVEYTSAGAGDSYFSGVSDTFSVTLTGAGSLYIDSASPKLKITGTVVGVGQVTYTQGQCSVTSVIPFISPCSKGTVTVPSSPSGS